ncbi:unnamed protein product [Mytilus edulis]|uniref:Uncharacterized protein n=1 Tax=Mytilus edulis TaxID=6550 RepID=A0A8S3QTX8_MYTED|nr:unnamed protein product [Mytilus edulis]
MYKWTRLETLSVKVKCNDEQITDGLHTTTNVSTKVKGVAGVWYTPDIMNCSIDINSYNLDLSGITSLVFEIKRCGRAHAILSSSDVRNSSEPLYGISIGYKTYKTFITYRADDSWSDGDIKLGTGNVVGENILGYSTNAPQFEVKSIGVLTDKGRLGNWKIQVEGAHKIDSSKKDKMEEVLCVEFKLIQKSSRGIYFRRR